MAIDGSDTRQPGKARQRHLMRRRKPERMAHVRKIEANLNLSTKITEWRARITKPSMLKIAGLASVALLAVFAAAYLVTGRIFPNVWSLDVSLGSMSRQEAVALLLDAWHNQVQIELVDNDRAWNATPAELGLRLDAQMTAERARGVGISGMPFGYSVEPMVSLDSETAQNFLTSMANQINVAPYNAGYEWQDDQLIGVPGREGQTLNIARTLERLAQEPEVVVSRQRLDLVVTPQPPEVADSSSFLEEAHLLASTPFELIGYDSFTNETFTWTTSREVFATWLEAGSSGLTLRMDAFLPFVEAQNVTLNTGVENVRYLDPGETSDAMRQAIANSQSSITLRIRYSPTTYTVVSGDTGYRIARKTGIPFYLIEQANPDIDLAVLSPGDRLNLPSRDLTVPLEPVANKRIVVNLETQWLVAYENGQQMFSWPISSGIESAPTSPGIFQILSHEPVAYGSSYILCGDSGCGQWEMQWFIGIYEVVPGLVNGFHGAVLLPDGTYLGGGSVGTPYTLGCVMSRNDEAQRLYEWADEGTIVEIISSDFQPQSDLGRAGLGEAFAQDT